MFELVFLGTPRREIFAVGCRDIEIPCASLPTSPPQQPRSPARTPGFSTYKGRVPARDGLAAGGDSPRSEPVSEIGLFGGILDGKKPILAPKIA